MKERYAAVSMSIYEVIRPVAARLARLPAGPSPSLRLLWPGAAPLRG